MPRIFLYPIARDFGFAPNPFHGVCTLATCKPRIRKAAVPGDWVFGMGGSRLNARGRCIFAMRVERGITFDEYWSDPEFFRKRPVRNGSLTTMVGDNIYHRTAAGDGWHQADSHHSLPEGVPNPANIKTDTRADRVLVSRHFIYFGRNAPEVPPGILEHLGFRRIRDFRAVPGEDGTPLIEWFQKAYGADIGKVLGDPFDFEHSAKRYSAGDDKVR